MQIGEMHIQTRMFPLSTSTKKTKYYASVGRIDGKEARAIISQVRLVDTRRLENKICVLDKKTFATIKKAVKAIILNRL